MLRGLSCTAQPRQPVEMRELVSHNRPATRRRRALDYRGHSAPGSRDYSVDQKVYVGGPSVGAAAAAILGVTYNDLYAVVGIHSGRAYGAPPTRPPRLPVIRDVLPLIYVHGCIGGLDKSIGFLEHVMIFRLGPSKETNCHKYGTE